MESTYIFELNYGKRLDEKQFIKDILNRYSSSKLTGANIFVNNNPYSFEFYLHLTFKGVSNEFDEWLYQNYREKKIKHNYFLGDIFSSIATKGYNGCGLIGSDMVDFIITSEPNGIFLFPDKKTMDSTFRGGLIENDFIVFLSHSSKDKHTVDRIFYELQKSEIRAWYDKYEIDPGDSIVDKINDGLAKSDVGIILLSKNFFNPTTGWTKSEMNYFIQKRMQAHKKEFVCVNIDLNHDELPPLIQEYRYIDFKQDDAINQLIQIIKKKSVQRY
ncbi:MAG: toll/interleukin-1 receptor domain-containing protein [Clostridia bacterium]|nr:toll/interleukin-1 receptor domain-containing protein [Clostridia bacterium]